MCANSASPLGQTFYVSLYCVMRPDRAIIHAWVCVNFYSLMFILLHQWIAAQKIFACFSDPSLQSPFVSIQPLLSDGEIISEQEDEGDYCRLELARVHLLPSFIYSNITVLYHNPAAAMLINWKCNFAEFLSYNRPGRNSPWAANYIGANVSLKDTVEMEKHYSGKSQQNLMAIQNYFTSWWIGG